MTCSHGALTISDPERLRYSPKGVLSQENGPHPPTTAPTGKRTCRTGPSARHVRGPQRHIHVYGVGETRRSHSVAVDRFAGGIGAARPFIRIVAGPSPMRRPALGRNPGRVEGQGRRGRRPWVLGGGRFVGRFGQQLVYLLLTQKGSTLSPMT
jgi:hypothetical protein